MDQHKVITQRGDSDHVDYTWEVIKTIDPLEGCSTSSPTSFSSCYGKNLSSASTVLVKVKPPVMVNGPVGC